MSRKRKGRRRSSGLVARGASRELSIDANAKRWIAARIGTNLIDVVVEALRHAGLI